MAKPPAVHEIPGALFLPAGTRAIWMRRAVPRETVRSGLPAMHNESDLHRDRVYRISSTPSYLLYNNDSVIQACRQTSNQANIDSSARVRWLSLYLNAAGMAAKLRLKPCGTKTGSYPNPPSPDGSVAMEPRKTPSKNNGSPNPTRH